MSIYLGLDLGTTVLKIIAMDDNGKILASTNKELLIHSPKREWAEEHPEEWWSTFKELLKRIEDRIDLKDVKGLALSGQMHGLVTYDENFELLRPAIIWADKRSSKEVDHAIKKLGTKKIYDITGNPIFTGFLLPSLMWLKAHEASLYKRIKMISSPKDYIAYKFTGELSSEPTDALATSAFDYMKNEWSKDVIKEMGINPKIFPEIRPTSTAFGMITSKASKETGLPIGIPVYGGSDQSMAAMGCGLVREGDVMVALSTGGQCLIVAEKGHMDKKRRLHTLNHALDDVGLYMAATLSAGLSLKWFKANIINEMDTTYSSFVHGIRDIPVGCDGLFFLPFLSGQRTPYFNPNLKGAFVGLSLTHTRMHMARAIMEGVSFSLRACVEVFKDMDMPIKRVILSGGGTKNSTWRQILTDVLNVETVTINIEEHSPFGAAIYAKFAQDGFDKLPAFYEKNIKTADTIKPLKHQVKEYDLLYKEYMKHANYLNDMYK
jgi:xylulokinase